MGPRTIDEFYTDCEDDEDRAGDDLEEAIMNCGMVRGQGCTLAGTEWCDWDCPFNR